MKENNRGSLVARGPYSNYRQKDELMHQVPFRPVASPKVQIGECSKSRIISVKPWNLSSVKNYQHTENSTLERGFEPQCASSGRDQEEKSDESGHCQTGEVKRRGGREEREGERKNGKRIKKDLQKPGSELDRLEGTGLTPVEENMKGTYCYRLKLR